MTILNLTTFLRTCQTTLVYHKKDGYHIFTNQIVSQQKQIDYLNNQIIKIIADKNGVGG